MKTVHERFLAFLLRAIAAVSAFSIIGIFMPHSWMAKCHDDWLGLGATPLPDQPVIGYLTRSLSLFYLMMAGLVWLAATDVRRHSVVVTYILWAFIVFGIVTTGIDLHANMPWLWTVGEGPVLVVLGAFMLWLQRKVASSGSQDAEE